MNLLRMDEIAARSERKEPRANVIPAARKPQASARICPCIDRFGGDSGDRLVSAAGYDGWVATVAPPIPFGR